MRFTEPSRPPRARATLEDGRIFLRGDYDPRLVEFYHSLPGSRWDNKARAWVCRNTEAAAWRLRQQNVSLSPVLYEGARIFAVKCALKEDAQLRLPTALSQPHIRATEAWQHQLTAFHCAYSLQAALLAMDMGTGKSKVAVDLCVNWQCNRTLILCPTSVRQVWHREFHFHGDGRPICVLSTGSVEKRTNQAIGFLRRGNGLRPGVLVINYEAAWRKPFAEWALAQDWDLVICDESHRIKAHNSKISKFCAGLYYCSQRRLCLTGTPLGQSQLDGFGQYRFLDPGLFGDKWFHYSNRYAIKSNPNIPQQITGYKNQEEMKTRMALVTYRCRADDVLDLPEVSHHDRTFTLASKARRAYRELEQNLIADLGSGVVTAANALVRLLRLQQCTSGFLVEDDTDRVVVLDDSKEKLLEDILADLPPREPVCVFCRFRHDLDAVQRVAGRTGRRYAELSGRRHDLTDRATMPEDCDLMAVQIQSGGVGIDLTRAHYFVYYSLGFSRVEYEQSLKRGHRPGQTHHTHFYHLIADGTVDRRVYGALQTTGDLIEAVLKGLCK